MGDFIRIERLKKKWSQEILAQEIGTRRQVIHRIESGLQLPTLEQAFRISMVLGFNLREFEKFLGKKWFAIE